MAKYGQIIGNNNFIGTGTEFISVVNSSNCQVFPYGSGIAFVNSSGCTSGIGSVKNTFINSSGCTTHTNSTNITLINCSAITTDEFDNNQVYINNHRVFPSRSIQVTASSAYTVSPEYDMHYVDPTGGDVTVQFPDPVRFKDHPGLCFKRTTAGTNNIKFYSFASETIEFGTSPQTFITSRGDVIIFTSDGVNWYQKSTK